MKKIALSRKELEAFAVNALGLQCVTLRRMSTQVLAQLLQLNISSETNVFEMVNEIKYLEDLYHGVSQGTASGHGAAKASGAWIVFKRHNGINYYLTVAKMDEGDQYINQRLRDAYAFDFPFLEEKHRFN